MEIICVALVNGEIQTFLFLKSASLQMTRMYYRRFSNFIMEYCNQTTIEVKLKKEMKMQQKKHIYQQICFCCPIWPIYAILKKK